MVVLYLVVLKEVLLLLEVARGYPEGCRYILHDVMRILNCKRDWLATVQSLIHGLGIEKSKLCGMCVEHTFESWVQEKRNEAHSNFRIKDFPHVVFGYKTFSLFIVACGRYITPVVLTIGSHELDFSDFSAWRQREMRAMANAKVR